MDYRLILPLAIRNDSILLIVDGHPSRRNYLVNYIFSYFNVDIVVLPGHTSHVLPLKSQYTMIKIPDNFKFWFEDEILSGKWMNSEEILRELFSLQLAEKNISSQK